MKTQHSNVRRPEGLLTVTTIDDPDIADLYAYPLVLVQPDGPVAWRGRPIPDDPEGLIDRIRGAG